MQRVEVRRSGVPFPQVVERVFGEVCGGEREVFEVVGHLEAEAEVDCELEEQGRLGGGHLGDERGAGEQVREERAGLEVRLLEVLAPEGLVAWPSSGFEVFAREDLEVLSVREVCDGSGVLLVDAGDTEVEERLAAAEPRLRASDDEEREDGGGGFGEERVRSGPAPAGARLVDDVVLQQT